MQRERKGLSAGSDLPSLTALSDTRGIECKRSRRGDSPDLPVQPPLGLVERDQEGKIVYVDLQPQSSVDDGLDVLRSRLLTIQPKRQILDRLLPINRGRLLVEIEDVEELT